MISSIKWLINNPSVPFNQITIQYLGGLNTNPETMMYSLKEDMRNRCKNTRWEIIQKNSNSILYEQSINDCKHDTDQYEISRIFLGKEGVHRLSCTEKSKELEPNVREEWINKLKISYIEKDGIKVSGIR